jgi:DNA-binding NtrC family response regulator
MIREPRRARIVVVDDNRFDRELVREALEAEIGSSALLEELSVECCDSGEAALALLDAEPADVVISDLTMPGLSGLDLLERINREHPETDFVLLTANATVDSAVEALRRRAFDYLRKPIQPGELAHAVQRTLTQRWLVRENERLG